MIKSITTTVLICFAIILGNSESIYGQNNSESNMELTVKQKSIISIAAYAAKGDLNLLKSALNEGLNAGLTINETKEILVHLYAYCGFPRSIRGLQTLMVVLDDRKSNGIQDVLGPDASPIQDERSKYDRGKEILGILTGVSQEVPKSGYSAFSPEIDRFLKEHLFADIFERDVLTYSDRELVTISVLASIGEAQPMLRAHLNICLNLGLTSSQLRQFATIINPCIGQIEADKTLDIVNDVMNQSMQK